MQAFLHGVSTFVLKALGAFLPQGIYERLSALYDISLLLLAAGAVFLVAAVLALIVRVLVYKRKHAA